jgi:hypothetical protein
VRIDLDIAPSARHFSRSVVQRVIMAAAAQANLSLDRSGDLQLAAELMTLAASSDCTKAVQLRIMVAGSSVELAVGPLSAGEATTMAAAQTFGDTGSLLDEVTDSVWVTPTAQGESLNIRVRGDLVPAAPTVS